MPSDKRYRRSGPQIVEPPNTEQRHRRFVFEDLTDLSTAHLRAESRLISYELAERLVYRRRDRHAWAFADGAVITENAWLIARQQAIAAALARRTKTR